MSQAVDASSKVLKQGLVDLISEEEFEERLRVSLKKKQPLRVKYGADPSAPDLHLGHTVPLRKLRQFQEYGHTVVFIIGDFTAQIGDPTQRTETRRMLFPAEVQANAQTYQKQVFKILDPQKTEVRYNSEWLAKMTPADFMRLTAQYTVARLLERDDFQKRYQSNLPITLVEFLYPLLQGYDSVQVKSDIELGGTDQKFNFLVGRDLQRSWGEKPQIVMTMPLIEGTEGIQKMSKSLGNHIGIQESPREIFGKVMSIPDKLLERYYTYVSGFPQAEIQAILQDLKAGALHPRDAKAQLAEGIVKLYHSAEEAVKARHEFDHVFKSKGLPEEIPTFKIAQHRMDIVSLLKEVNLVASKGEGRRLIQQGGVKINQEKVNEIMMVLEIKGPLLIQCGKRKFARVEYAGG